jgi:hypothetical protein
MKVLGFVIIVLGIVCAYIGITGTQHNVMAILKGTNKITPSGLSINPSASPNKITTTNKNSQTNQSEPVQLD